MIPGAAARSALGELLTNLVDYAGLFPPAALPMRDAVLSYDEYRRGSTAWALGRFVVTVARLAEFEGEFAVRAAGGSPWRLSVLAAPADLETVIDFNTRLAGSVVFDTVEGKASSEAEIAEFAGCSVENVKVRVHRAIKDLRKIFFEISGETAR